MARSKKANVYRLSASIVTVLLALVVLYLTRGQELFSGTGNTPISSAEPPQQYDLRVTMLDVGQGDSILLSSGGQTMLVDAGENDQGDRVVNYLKGFGVTKLAIAVGTHPHSDHIGGLDTVLKAFPTEALYMPAKTQNTETYEDVLDAAAARGLKVTVPKPGDQLTLGKAKITFLWPAKGYDSDNVNNCSIVLMAEADGRRVLLCGDAEKDAEKGILDLGEDIHCDVLKVAHHGSDTSSTQAFLKQAMPTVALISVGLNNDYHHPDQTVLQRLLTIGAQIHRTDQNGSITITIFNGQMTVQDSKKPE